MKVYIITHKISKSADDTIVNLSVGKLEIEMIVEKMKEKLGI